MVLKHVKDVLIVGGGVMGSSAAYHLAKKAPHLKITVVERSFAYKRASAVLSAGGIRMQFSERPNIEMSQYGIQFLKNAGQLLHVPGHDPVDVQFTEGGYLFLATDRGTKVLEQNHATQRSVNAKVVLMNPSDLSARFPWLDTTDISCGSLGLEDEGWFDPWSYLTGLKKANTHLGVEYVEGTIVEPMGKRGDVIDHVTVATTQGEVAQYAPGHVVNAAGAWAHEVGTLAGIADLPVRARKRTVFVFHCPEASNWTGTMASPLVVDPSGVYFRREGGAGQFICGVSPAAEDDPDCDGDDLLQPDHALFDDKIWPTIAARVPAFNELKLVNSWAGFYDYNTFDHNAILGRHPDVANLFCINGFSGHGLQQSPAAGRAIAELIVDGAYTSLDLTCFGFDRIRANAPYFEKNIV
ncbi:hypothetical protein H310_02420 [Aphanomyces invadans]|uniref:FAD-dependent oxidoreductase domain-containing protein 1 n=1 Tax=Aphanomyces invadans TaxID=157072 RepID=A0A024UNM7_9STRA|nr:hypothetical protein H310_02420 [Aphanomyces invadans]ETW08051.1 hypothetical protein H310_02420 [Aphanomyces invadans]|eukprot:XP_008864144.1 hypothetical protein H310_02420 [Aphanomyces invadans]